MYLGAWAAYKVYGYTVYSSLERLFLGLIMSFFGAHNNILYLITVHMGRGLKFMVGKTLVKPLSSNLFLGRGCIVRRPTAFRSKFPTSI